MTAAIAIADAVDGRLHRELLAAVDELNLGSVVHTYSAKSSPAHEIRIGTAAPVITALGNTYAHAAQLALHDIAARRAS